MKRLGMMGATSLSAALALALLGAGAGACGDVSGTSDLFTSTGNGGSASSSSSGVTTGPASSGSGSTTTGSTGTTASSSSGGTTTSSVASSSSGGPLVQVACNSAACQPGQICCFNPNGPGDRCAPAGTCAAGYVQLSCNGPEDCPGGDCCATVDVNKQVPYLGMACAASCNPSNQVVVCSAQQPQVCPQSTQCQSSQSLGVGYYVCWPG